MEKALLLVDIQNDFCLGGALAVPNGDQVVAIANQAIDVFNMANLKIIATLDWHPASHRSFACNSGTQVGTLGTLCGLPQIWWPVHCVQGEHGADLHPDLQKQYIDCLIYKGQQEDIDSYSAFFDNGHKTKTELDRWLQENAIQCLVVMGLATDYCVKYTVLDALQLGYQVEVLIDGCRGVNLQQNDSAQALAEMEAAGARLISLSQLSV